MRTIASKEIMLSSSCSMRLGLTSCLKVTCWFSQYISEGCASHLLMLIWLALSNSYSGYCLCRQRQLALLNLFRMSSRIYCC
jgi:hypothetical protein